MAKHGLLNKLLRRDDKGLSGMTITITQDGASPESVSSTGGATTSGAHAGSSIPLIGSLPARVQYWIGGGMLLVSLVAGGVLTIVAERQKNELAHHISSITSLKGELLSLQQNAGRLASGLDTFAPSAYLNIKAVEDDFIYMRSPVFSDQPVLGGKERADLNAAWNEWSSLRAARDQITSAHIAILTVRSKFAGSRAAFGAASSALANLIASKNTVDDETVALATKTLPALNRMKSRVDNGEANVSYAASAKEADEFLDQMAPVLKMTTDGVKDPELKKSIDDSLKFLKVFIPSAKKLNSLLVDMTETRARSSEMQDASGRVLQLADNVNVGLDEKLDFYKRFNWAISFFSLLALASMALLAVVNNTEGKKRTFEAKNENEANQRAIMSLLDEIANLADGDLTVRATVTEEITGAIADSVNFAIGEMGGLVTSIKSASTQISDAVGTATSNSAQLRDINAKQSKDITDTGKSVLSITSAIEQVSKRMEDSKRVAQSSVESSEKGMQAVHTSIEGIKSIRENVEETGKRIKRLTEQSIQISEIVELIGDISERTSVLAINATVQATKAGAAGKGFKVVADAVQDLANQASEATRRIGALINAIQTDIQGAGVAMQKTTEEAVRGAQLAETTGEVLAEINDVSLALADIVAEVNEQIGTSARSATDVSLTMKRVLESVVDSNDATKATGEAVEAINKLTEQLRESVSGFQL